MTRDPVVILYSRPDCHLCEEAERALRPILHRHGVALRKVDVDEDALTRARYGNAIPVAVLEGRVLFKLRCEPAVLERRLAARLRARRGR